MCKPECRSLYVEEGVRDIVPVIEGEVMVLAQTSPTYIHANDDMRQKQKEKVCGM